MKREEDDRHGGRVGPTAECGALTDRGYAWHSTLSHGDVLVYAGRSKRPSLRLPVR